MPKRRRFDDEDIDLVIPPAPRKKEPVSAKTPNQKKYITAISSSVLTFGIGFAGVGKTYLAAALAASALDEKHTQKIILTRPAVEAGEKLGFLPGEKSDKYEPYIAPFRDVLNERLGKSYVESLIKNGHIEPRPLAYMRGSTFSNAWVILDEAQNTTPAQMKMFLTRIGSNCTVIVNGDESQKDIIGISGLTDAISRLSFIPSIRVVRFDHSDIIRSSLVAEIAQAYDTPIQILTNGRVS